MRTFLEEDGTRTDWMLDGNKAIVRHTRDVEPLLNDNVRLQNETSGYNSDRTMKHIASVDRVVLQKWLQEAGISEREFWKNRKHYSKWLRAKVNDPDNRMFRTSPDKTPGRLAWNPEFDAAISEGRRLGM